jgi:hypothetical protein
VIEKGLNFNPAAENLAIRGIKLAERVGDHDGVRHILGHVRTMEMESSWKAMSEVISMNLRLVIDPQRELLLKPSSAMFLLLVASSRTFSGPSEAPPSLGQPMRPPLSSRNVVRITNVPLLLRKSM